MMSRKQVPTPLSFKLCIFLKTSLFSGWHIPIILLGDVLPDFLFQPYPATKSWPCSEVKPLAIFLDPTRTRFFDAGNPTRLLSFQKAGFHLVNPPPGGQPIFGGGEVPWFLFPTVLVSILCSVQRPSLSHHPQTKLPNAQKVIGGRLQPHPARLRWPIKHTAGVHRSCWTPSLHSLKLGFSQGFMRFTWNFWDETNNSPLKNWPLNPTGKDHRLPTIHFQGSATSCSKYHPGGWGFVSC